MEVRADMRRAILGLSKRDREADEARRQATLASLLKVGEGRSRRMDEDTKVTLRTAIYYSSLFEYRSFTSSLTASIDAFYCADSGYSKWRRDVVGGWMRTRR
jgi:hypothetical protein